MFKKMNKLFALLLVLVLSTATLSYACADDLVPYADSVFNSVTINLKSTKSVKYTAVTYDPQGTLSVTSCWLEKQSGSSWSRVCSLPKPAASYNTFGYAKTMDYSSYIGSGTFRVGAVFNADGHQITRYSNSRSF